MKSSTCRGRRELNGFVDARRRILESAGSNGWRVGVDTCIDTSTSTSQVVGHGDLRIVCITGGAAARAGLVITGGSGVSTRARGL